MNAAAMLNPTLLAADLARIIVPLAAGLLAGALLDRSALPRVRSEASPWAQILGAGLWIAAYAALAWASGRPVFAGCALLALHGGLVALDNAKYRACDEPLVFADLGRLAASLADSRRAPPWVRPRAVLAWGLLAAFALAGIGSQEPALAIEAIVPLAVLLAGAIAATRGATDVALRGLAMEPVADLARFGLVPGLWLQAIAERRMPARRRLRPPVSAVLPDRAPDRLPNVLCMQAESFVDARRFHPAVRRDVLARFDALAATALHRGRLDVPASGGGVVRAEHAFITGLPPRSLGIDRFDPYRRIDGTSTPSFVRELRERGYVTVCLSPRLAVEGRRRALEGLGFDHVVDVSALAAGEPDDLDLAEAVLRLLEGASESPLFVLALAMPEPPGGKGAPSRAEDLAAVYAAPPPAGCEALTAYLRRLRDADAMLARLSQGLRWLERDTVACLYGAHAPILPRAYDVIGTPDARTDYLVWRAHRDAKPRERDRAVEDLGALLVSEALRVPAAPREVASPSKVEPSPVRAAIIRSSVGA